MNNSLKLDTIRCGDCEKILKKLPDSSIDLVITSPPYADCRKKIYKSVHPDDYVNWFMPKADQIFRVLKPDGTFILNIKERVMEGERHTFAIELILEMRKHDWLWTEEYIWHKKNCAPGKWSNRFRDSWERCLQFNKNRHFKMYQDNVMVPIGEWSKDRLKNLNNNDLIVNKSKVNSGFKKNIANWKNREMVYPTNVLHMATECKNKNHCAAFPESLPEFFIKLFTAEGDIVLDPFIGSGTTAVVAKKLSRHYIGIDVEKQYCESAKERINQIT